MWERSGGNAGMVDELVRAWNEANPGRKIVLTMPGSRAAVRLAMEKIILPELGHLVREARR